MNDLFHGFECIHYYIDDILILTKEDWPDHIWKLEIMIGKLKRKGPKCNIGSSLFGKTKCNIYVSG